MVRKRPTFSIDYNEDNTVMTATIYVSKEESAKDIDVDVSTNALKLVSEQYVIFFNNL